ncbi:protein spaetzle 5 [Procambarus clarkii]|uniref:protein spaetzle 5 n=1 Tax=Procambarus clarkii TaxID=6728 RepID=UPI001E678E77|nr:protein spaetzle 5-like [Procambarus clarkii]
MGLVPMEVGPTYPNSGFVPEVNGGTPDCVKDPRDTFCLEPKKYPKDRIVYLLENKMFDVDSLLMDETRDSYTFEARESPTQPMTYDYEPPAQTFNQPKPTYGPPRPTFGAPQPATGYLPPPRHNFTSTPKPYVPPPPSTKYGAPPPSRFYNQPGPTLLYEPPPTPVYDNEGPYPRYPKTSGSYIPRYSPVPRSPPKPQPWWTKVRASPRRQRRQASSTDLCPYESEFIMPRAALNNKGDWMFLVNVNEVSTEYTQLVESKKCITNTCTGFCSIPDGFTSVCQQQYVQKRLIALDGSGMKLATDTFWFPSCCVCKIRPIGG